MKKIVQLFLLLTVFQCNVEFAVSSPGEVNNLTVSDYLQQKKAEAIKQGRQANHLINESSPYLLQHAYNPVNWYPWGEQAFARARKENKPIFLSIGYSTCHWCHVMARESFENAEIAAILNKYFISIKVDREQRPDIDAVYMAATQLINGHGGWPMSVFLDARLRPFHAATYYPPFSTDRYTGLKDVLLKVNTLWHEQPDTLKQVATQVTARIIAYADDTLEEESLDPKIDERAMQQIRNSYDAEYGGFSAAPKFPRPGIFAYLNRLSAIDQKRTAASQKTPAGEVRKIKPKQMMETTLNAMLAGGIYDQLAGGFHRYSVDERWQVPHFEKMLYSQALMVIAYSDLYRIDPDERYKRVVAETLAFVRHEMQSAEGGFYSALDADSERPHVTGDEAGHAEGAYYLWSEEALRTLLSEDEFRFVKTYFDIREHGNISSDPQQEFTDLNILYIDEDYRSAVLTPAQSKWLKSAKTKLNAKRLTRPRPHLDDKVITAWNAMMITAFARASIVFDEPRFLDEAVRSMSYLRKILYDKKSGELYRQHRAGNQDAVQAVSRATLADYAWLIYGLLEIYDADMDEGQSWLSWALVLQKKQDELFMDKSSGTYFESTADDKNLLFRSKNIYDDALPSANAIALANLRHLAVLSEKAVDKKMYDIRAAKLVGSFANVVNQNPSAASMLLSVELR